MKKDAPLEIERKYLIGFPNLSVLEAQPDYTRTQITQVYIKSVLDGAFGRIRKRGCNGEFSYTKTFKRDITAATRIEIESEITAEEYAALLNDAREDFSPIEKDRITFSYGGKTIEIDLYPFWQDKAIMEIELESESEAPSLPPFIAVLADVTENKAFRNSEIARNGAPAV